MNPDECPMEIVVCLGSSCFARGNSENLAIVNTYVKSRGLNASTRLTGKLCQDECMQGPNLSIGGKIYHGVTTTRLRELLEQLGNPSRGEHGTT